MARTIRAASSGRFFFRGGCYIISMKVVFSTILAVVILSAALWFFMSGTLRRTEKTEAPATKSVETVRLKTQDGVEIIGDYYPPAGEVRVVKGASRGVILIHMMPADRKSWAVFAKKLSEVGLPTLAIDLRGHGESQGGPDGYKSFSDAEHQNSKLDVIAAALFLRSKKVDEFHVVGASIGANLALQYAAEHPNARSAVLLSPGLDYRGLKTAEFMEKVPPSRGIYLAASEDDSYSRDTVNDLASRITLDEKHQVEIFESGGHGTTIFENHPEFMDELTEWLKQM